MTPLFPLPSTVFYPNTLLPLHIFEPRYREMVADALEGDRQIGMVLLKPGWEKDYYGNPEIAAIGCVGEIDKHIRLPDGKYNILLKGLSRYKIHEEIPGRSYRRARVERLPEINDESLETASSNKQKLADHFQEYLALLPEEVKSKTELQLESFGQLSHLVDQMAYEFDLTVEQKQSILEEQDVQRRVQTLHSILQMKINLINLSKAQIRNGFDVRMN